MILLRQGDTRAESSDDHIGYPFWHRRSGRDASQNDEILTHQTTGLRARTTRS